MQKVKGTIWRCENLSGRSCDLYFVKLCEIYYYYVIFSSAPYHQDSLAINELRTRLSFAIFLPFKGYG